MMSSHRKRSPTVQQQPVMTDSPNRVTQCLHKERKYPETKKADEENCLKNCDTYPPDGMDELAPGVLAVPSSISFSGKITFEETDDVSLAADDCPSVDEESEQTELHGTSDKNIVGSTLIKSEYISHGGTDIETNILEPNISTEEYTEACDKDFNCDKCKYKHNLLKPCKAHAVQKPYVCDICDSKFRQKSVLKKHLETHTGEDCDYTCSQADDLKSHIEADHTDEKPLTCDICDYKCTDSAQLMKHKSTHQGGFDCELCDFKTKRSHELMMHMSIHTEEKSFACSVCDYRSRRTSDLRRHLRIHTGEKPYSCHLCDYKSSDSSALRVHRKIHTGEESYSCDLCDYKCFHSSALKLHRRRRHAGEVPPKEPFACNICDYKSTKANNMKRHMMTHSGEKPYACEVCAYKTCSASALRRHSKTHSGGVKRYRYVVNNSENVTPVEDDGRLEDECEDYQNKLVDASAAEEPCSVTSKKECSQDWSDFDASTGNIVQVKEEKNEDDDLEGGMDDLTPAEDANSSNDCQPDTNEEDLGNAVTIDTDNISPDTGDVMTEIGECPSMSDGSESSELPDPSSEPLGGIIKLEVMPHFLETESSIDTVASVSVEKIPTCGVCGLTFQRKDQLNRHKRSHTGNEKLACEFCGKAYSRRDNLKRHMMIHTGQTHQCNVCDYKSNIPSHFKRHLLAHSGESNHVCPVCNNSYSDSYVLKLHMRTHTGEKPYACGVCAYRCSRPDHMKVHMQTHTGEKRFACEFCDYKCSQSNDLRRHMRTHTGEKPFTCEFCDYRCCEAGTLKTHVRTHTDERPFACSVCEYKCRRAGDLKLHLMVHTGEKPFECDMCSYKTNQSSVLLRHKRTHTEFGAEKMVCTADALQS